MAAIAELPPPLNAKHYTSAPHQQVLRFMQQHSWLVPILQEADRVLLTTFPANTRIMLAVAHDPESPDEEYLVYGIETAQPLADARACLQAFDDAWLLDSLERLQDKVLFRLRFV
jgi:hypothetical protein